MREIKFKVWDKSENQMARGINKLLFNSKGLYGVMINHMGFEFKRRLKDVELLEYTGLKDKNGKEIYEGDILQAEHFSYTGTYGLVVIKFGEYVDTGFLDDSNYEAQGVGFHAYLTKVKETCGIQKDMMQGMVIIGNIYEKPELLEATDE